MPCSYRVLPHISTIAGSISFLSSFIAQIPQVLETYVDKTVEGLSPLFLLAWLFGDITTLIGATLTNQLPFQIILALYFLANDLFICGQYYYYGVMHNNELATPGHEYKTSDERLALVRSRGSELSIGAGAQRRSWIASLLCFGSQANAMPLAFIAENSGNGPSSSGLGMALAWAGAMCYVSARIPQLIKNYQRKSTDGLSPFLFINTLIANLTYTISIFTSCEFLSNDDRWGFAMSELPFIIGSTGTILFDLIYFYQHYILYASDMRLRELEAHVDGPISEEERVARATETTPLL
ncbi:LAQU0S04e00848g1_1 [Lachancea quebecensis]|uniref:LAQU0S04e00848g1_1 n=1 Tax=Lachancea quebecensis TaxID=1654605 RepID=A0A0P1KP43_9SACH|nr:LAQU0S04e00848g1_1 [Lachancea quebecensis]